jgi:hypothetical protein
VYEYGYEYGHEYGYVYEDKNRRAGKSLSEGRIGARGVREARLLP